MRYPVAVWRVYFRLTVGFKLNWSHWTPISRSLRVNWLQWLVLQARECDLHLTPAVGYTEWSIGLHGKIIEQRVVCTACVNITRAVHRQLFILILFLSWFSFFHFLIIYCLYFIWVLSVILFCLSLPASTSFFSFFLFIHSFIASVFFVS